VTLTDELVPANGTTLHVSTCGTGPALLLVPGAGGDAGQYEQLASRLAAVCTVISYDRRANSRSPHPPGDRPTSIEEQADDAIALLDALRLAPAVVFGNSLGALIALSCALRAPSLVSQLVLHEPALMGVLEDPDAALAAVQPVIGEGMATGGIRGGAEAFFRFADSAAFACLPQPTRERMLDNAGVLFESEFAVFASWRPDPAAVAALTVPVTVLVGTDSRAPAFREASAWLARHTQAPVIAAPGGHMGFAEQPDAFAVLLRDELRRV
jgi:pimeloyl-ACP methyl ester carboxylesterase